MAQPLPPELLSALTRIERRPSWPLALATALLPLAGVWLFEWPVAAVIGIYWLDNVLIGVSHALKMASAHGRMLDPAYEATLRANAQWSDAQKDEIVRNAKAFQHHVMPWFFAVHYGLFCAGHAAFIGFLFDGAFDDGVIDADLSGQDSGDGFADRGLHAQPSGQAAHGGRQSAWIDAVKTCLRPVG